MKADKILEIARTKLILKYPFYGTMIVYLSPRPDPNKTKTISTDGKRMYYNPEWIEELAENEGLDSVIGVLAHMVMHCGLGHLWRRGDRSVEKWGLSTDLVVNEIVMSSDLKIPEDSVLIDMFKEFGVNRDMAAEEVYATLPDIPELLEKVSFLSREGGGKTDDHSQWGKEAKQEGMEDLKNEWKQRLASAAQSAKQRGDMPAHLQKLVDDTLNPTIDWKAILAEWLQPSRCEYTYLPSDRRFVHNEMYIPEFGGQALQDIVIAIDTSGSTFFYEKTVDQFIAECKAILSVGKWSRLHVVYCDTEINKWVEIDEPSDFPGFEVCGGGGTDFVPVFEEIERRGIQPVALVYLTDGYGRFPDEEPGYPVLWTLTSDGIDVDSVPFGLAVKMKELEV